jgi:hypothetical protein
LSYRYNGRMRQALKVHPDSLCSAVTHIEVEIMRPCAGSLVLSGANIPDLTKLGGRA